MSEKKSLSQVHLALDKRLDDGPFWENMAGLNERERTFLLASNFWGEVGSGGVGGYLSMFGGETVVRTISALHEIGASDAAYILENAVNKLFNEIPPPNDWDQRHALLETTSDGALEELEQQMSQGVFQGLESLLQAYLNRYNEEIRSD